MAENTLPELPYERIAMAGGEMPDGLTSADQQLFIELRLLYDTFKRKVITREIAQKEKQKLLRNYQVNLIMQDFVRQWYSQNIKTESARQAYRKNRTLENADAIVFAFEGSPITIREDVL